MRRNETLFDLADWLTEPPSGGPLQKWGIGMGLASVVTGYGLLCCLTQRATTLSVTMRGFRSLSEGLWLQIGGLPAVTLGLCIVFIGLFTHFQWFWGNQERLRPLYEFFKYGAVLGLIAAIVGHLYAMIVYT